jgi:hypothetical protein
MSQREIEAGSALVPVAAASSAARHGDIVPLGDAGQQKRPMRIELSVSPGLRLEASGHTIGLHEIHAERN